MNRDEVIRMAQEAGFIDADWSWEIAVPLLEKFAALVAAAEREACAKVCDQVANKMEKEGEGPTGNIGWVDECSRGIRARGNDGIKP